ncbi:MAG: hypothetical protein INR72_17485 [Williamsia herbipolensis]|nr:hypothetical protein [Williamsia herbipolensis]
MQREGDDVAVLYSIGVPVAAVLLVLLLVLTIRGSMRPGPTQLRQDAESRQRRGQRSTNRRLLERCDDCGHPWQEHPGAPGIASAECVTCASASTGSDTAGVEWCHERVPSSLLQAP